jgi:hypothetical protein
MLKLQSERFCLFYEIARPQGWNLTPDGAGFSKLKL